eukprot:c20179_g1_i2.p1 GENE.c20179_g1_i2~~c20179_g1_i2.p1  ORF type:complete len:741 (+),score=144.22 c20179_g1_i2:346-2568(+)
MLDTHNMAFLPPRSAEDKIDKIQASQDALLLTHSLVTPNLSNIQVIRTDSERKTTLTLQLCGRRIVANDPVSTFIVLFTPSATVHTGWVITKKTTTQLEFPKVSNGTLSELACALTGGTGLVSESPLLQYVTVVAGAVLDACQNFDDGETGVARATHCIEEGSLGQFIQQFVQGTHAAGVNSKLPDDSILEHIRRQRVADVAWARARVPQIDLIARLKDAPPLKDFSAAIRGGGGSTPIGVLAELKRASPSKGDIFPNADAAEISARYARAGAVGVSVLTEGHWFKGTLADLVSVRQSVEAAVGARDRPVVLRKDFIIDEYQIYEARVYGADSLLLIVAILSDDHLANLLETSRSLGMEPLVEVANADEMKRALHVGAQLIGINNRNLHTFSVDMSTTERLVADVRDSAVTFIALSGIQSRADVQRYMAAGARAVLVGEALMRSQNPTALVRALRGLPPQANKKGSNTGTDAPSPPLVKICGCTDASTALWAAKSGADFIGLVFAESPRQLDVEAARGIVEAVHNLNPYGRDSLRVSFAEGVANYHALHSAASLGPLVVGVFADQSKDLVNTIASSANIDVIQLSGDEGLTNSELSGYCRPVIKAIHVSSEQQPQQLVQVLDAIQPHTGLLDTKSAGARGGTGETFDWAIATAVLAAGSHPFFLAGGLNPENINAAVEGVRPWAVDVSSGVESVIESQQEPPEKRQKTHNHTPTRVRRKDLDKIRDFVALAKTVETGLIQ